MTVLGIDMQLFKARRFVRFSLWMLFAGIAPFCILAAIAHYRMDRLDRHRRSVAELGRLGVAAYEGSPPPTEALHPEDKINLAVDVFHDRLAQDWSPDRFDYFVHRLIDVKRLYLSGDDLSLDIMARVKDINSIREMGLYCNKLSQEHLRNITGFRNIESLHLSGSRGFETLRPLQSLPALKRISVNVKEIADSDFTDLAGFPQLRSLFLDIKITVSNKNIACLAASQSLRELVLPNSELREEAAQALSCANRIEQLFVDYCSSGAVQQLKKMSSLKLLVVHEFDQKTAEVRTQLPQAYVNPAEYQYLR